MPTFMRMNRYGFPVWGLILPLFLWSASSCKRHTEKVYPQFIHAVAGLPEVRIEMQEETRYRNLSFGTSTGYLEVKKENDEAYHTVFRLNDETLTGSLYRTPFREEEHYSIFLSGWSAAPEIFVLADDYAIPDSGKTHIRFLQLIPDAPLLDLNMDGQTLAENLMYYGNDSTKGKVDFLEVSRTGHTFELVSHATGVSLCSLVISPDSMPLALTLCSRGLVDGAGNLQPDFTKVIHRQK